MLQSIKFSSSLLLLQSTCLKLDVRKFQPNPRLSDRFVENSMWLLSRLGMVPSHFRSFHLSDSYLRVAENTTFLLLLFVHMMAISGALTP